MVVVLGLIANGLLILGAWWVAGHGLRHFGLLDRFLAGSVLAVAWCLWGLEILGTIGLMTLGPLLAWSAGLFVIGLVLRQVRPQLPAIHQGKVEPPWRAEALISMALVVWICVGLGSQSLLLPVKVVSDGPIYHLYFAARWWKAGRLFLVAAPFGENAATYFPANGDLWFAWLMTTWGGDQLARVGQAPFLLIAAFSTFATARLLGAGRNAAAIATCWFLSSTPLLLFSFEANVDTIFVAEYLVAVYFFLLFLLAESDRSALWIGGLAAGIAAGTKPVGIVFIAPLLALLLAAIAFRTRSFRPNAWPVSVGPGRRDLDLWLLVRPGRASDGKPPVSPSLERAGENPPPGLVRSFRNAVQSLLHAHHRLAIAGGHRLGRAGPSTCAVLDRRDAGIVADSVSRIRPSAEAGCGRWGSWPG